MCELCYNTLVFTNKFDKCGHCRAGRIGIAERTREVTQLFNESMIIPSRRYRAERILDASGEEQDRESYISNILSNYINPIAVVCVVNIAAACVGVIAGKCLADYVIKYEGSKKHHTHTHTKTPDMSKSRSQILSPVQFNATYGIYFFLRRLAPNWYHYDENDQYRLDNAI
jgi:hypothetical protein